MEFPQLEKNNVLLDCVYRLLKKDANNVRDDQKVVQLSADLINIVGFATVQSPQIKRDITTLLNIFDVDIQTTFFKNNVNELSLTSVDCPTIAILSSCHQKCLEFLLYFIELQENSKRYVYNFALRFVPFLVTVLYSYTLAEKETARSEISVLFNDYLFEGVSYNLCNFLRSTEEALLLRESV
ncbi:hypothetical protein EIN_059040 [Entamoeba invadens IP1]|uniref:hypothetical protein n=1 Tax=Entamoeba invadens IP1 TaxID=370355 RepID=UPI0002C3F13B|nr:hypothetical protein EIN_059040 [Entamoeba invadens IP1]ELP93439.1 hypothetical protein EIN_059040 [Entamoeba invadens IP1]|eukprot:XP_004260210.1 hypothetical protein EIN_059040 [Entamoeba invadens IP1]